MEPTKTTFEVVPTGADGVPWAAEQITCDCVNIGEDGSVEFLDDNGLAEHKLVAYFRHVHSVRRTVTPAPGLSDVRTLVVNITNPGAELTRSDVEAITAGVSEILTRRGLS